MSEVIDIKTPKKVLHFSDGIMEIYEDDEKETPKQEELEIDEVSIKTNTKLRQCILF